MNSKPFAVAATALSLLAGLPAIAAADVKPASPIVVTHTAISPAPGEATGPNFLKIAFHNNDRVAATKVVFAVTGGWHHQRIVDVGTFAPGAPIEHAFPDYSGAPERNVDVDEVDFSDGTTWKSANGSHAGR